MDQNPLSQEPIAGGSTDKKKILIFLALGIFVVLAIGIIFFMLSGTRRTATEKSKEKNNIEGSFPEVQVSPTIIVQTGESPEVAANNFYQWYVNHPSPIASGEYEKRTDVTDDFKRIMGIFVKRGVNPGYDHVFCENIVLPKTAVPENAIVDEDLTLALVPFKDKPEGTELFRMRLESSNGKWLVSDVKCSVSE